MTWNMSKKKSKNSQKSNFWLNTISELLIVILGILIALQIDNWNSYRKDRIFEQTLLEEFKENLSIDLKNIESNIESLEEIRTSNSIITDFLDNQTQYSDTLDKHFGNISSAVFLQPI